MRLMQTVLLVVATVVSLQGCATAVAIVDVTGAAVIYTGKTIINTVDAITPDIVNKD